MQLIFYIGMAVLAAIFFIVGFVKGFANIKSWAVDYTLATFSVLLVALITKNLDQTVRFYLLLGLSLGFLLLYTYSSSRIRKHVNKVGFINRVFGAVTLAIEAALIYSLIVALVIVAGDLLQINALNTFFADFTASGTWAFIKSLSFDFFFIGIVLTCLHCGNKGGLSNSLCTLAVLALIGGAGYLSYTSAFNSELLLPVAEGIKTTLGDKISFIPADYSLTVCKGIVTAGVFILLLVPIILFAIFVPKLLANARESEIFCAIDGTLGATVALILVFGLIFVLGSVLSTISDLEFMQTFNAYMEESHIAKLTYTDNLLNNLDFIKNLPLHDWITGVAPAN